MKRTLLLTVVLAVVILGLAGCRPTQEQAPDTATNELYSDWAGSESCAGCHPGNYNEWVQSGHPYKLNQVIDGQKPSHYPFTTLPDIPNANGLKDGDNTLGPPASYADVSYVIGGYNWKARFVDTNGYIITGADTQYNFETGGWVGYHDNETDKPYDCGKCHTSGWVSFDDGGTRRDSLPGMDGNFYAGGVHCEECHGPGAVHVANGGGKDTMLIDNTSAMCGRCHTRDAENRIAAKGGYIKHHEQYDELLSINPDNMVPQGKHLMAGIGCNQCHSPHASVVNDDKAAGIGTTKTCLSCHSDKAIVAAVSEDGLTKPMGATHAATDCIVCHMPKLTKSAVGHAGVGSGYQTGDIKTHIFSINLKKTDDQQFTESGSFAYPWITGKVACGQCHNGVTIWELHTPYGPGFTYKVHK